MLRSQGDPLSGLPFTTLPHTPLHKFDSRLLRVLLLRRLHLPLHCPPAFAGVAVHLTALTITVHVARGMKSQGGAVSGSVVARVCREAGARVSASVFLRDLDLSPWR